jgi:hypothetical protein
MDPGHVRSLSEFILRERQIPLFARDDGPKDSG